MSGTRAATLACVGIGLVLALTARGDSQRPERWFTAWGQPLGLSGVGVGTPPRGLDDTGSETCADCHSDIAEEWRDSLHRRSYSDGIFQAGYRADPLPMCRDCHAPLAISGRSVSPLAAAEGVSCSVCHVRDGEILAMRVTADGLRAHPMRRAPELADSAFCAGCHQFRFPAADMVKRLVFDPGELMQKTFAEWRASDAAARGQACRDCHMPTVGDSVGAGQHRSHRFRGLNDVDFVRGAISVNVQARDRGETVFVRASVEAHGVGHSLPTGDMFRQLVLRVWPEGRPELEHRVTVSREFGARAVIEHDRSDGAEAGAVADVTLLRAETRDRRIAAGEKRRFVFRLAGTSAGRVLYRLEIWRMSDAQARRQRLDRASTRVEIVTGSVPIVRRASERAERSKRSAGKE